jgi:hypothetical protein
VLVIGPHQIDDPFFSTNQSFAGYGVGQRSLFGLKRGVNYVTMRLALLSVKNGKEIARTSGFLSSERNRDWMESDFSMSESNAETTKAAIESLFASLLKKSLGELKLAAPAGS